MTTTSNLRVVLAVLSLAACAPGEQKGADSAALSTSPVAASVDITSPGEGDSVTLPITLTLGATGVVVVPATGQVEEGKGHHHLVIDGDVPADGAALPQPPVVYHLGNGASDKVIDSLPPGPHRVIAVFASGDHVAMPNVKRDTVTFIVK
ncbi:MAG: DUF4399 domain-containing protein [Cytophagaceae bacterium]|nr:DUF4399 domain-containing protein [Gemmatimonadaceae bacterium]